MHGSFLLITAGVMLAAGCAGSATAHPATRPSARPAGVAAKPAGVAVAKSAGVAASATSATPKQRAAADAKAILSSFEPPPGAVKLAKRPLLPVGGTMAMNSTTQVDAVAYWRVAGQPTALLAWEKAHISRRYSRQDVIIGPPSWDTVYSLPAIPGLLPLREMNVQAYADGGGMTVIMADAMVSWQPSRPATEAIPASLRVVRIVASGPWQGNPRPVTITSTSVVRQLAALVNSLPITTVDNGVPCPEGFGLTLTFSASGGRPVAAASGPAQCGVIDLTLRGQDEPDLQPPGSYLATVLKIAGLNWQLP